MMKTTLAIVLAALLTPALVGTSHAAGNIKAGKAKAAICAGCHGPGGNSTDPHYPKLAGQNAAYLITQLRLFKNGKRKNPMMVSFVTHLKPVDMEDIAAYFASQKRTISGASNTKLLSVGQKLYRGGNAKTGVSACMSCHGPTGKGIPPLFPRVSGQHAAYTEGQMLAFRSGKRQDPKDIMSRITKRMSRSEIKAVSEYIAGLAPAK